MIVFPEKTAALMKKATEKWGVETQFNMLVGEIGELLELYGKSVQNRDRTENWVEEVADVLIMCTQIAQVIGIEKVNEMIEKKVQKFQNKLEG